MNAHDAQQAVATAQGMVLSISAPQWLTWIAGSALALGLLVALAVVTSV